MPERCVLDASALLCLLNGEKEAERVAAVLDGAIISAMNYSEVIAKIVERGGSPEMIAATLDPLQLPIIDFDRVQALRAGGHEGGHPSFGPVVRRPGLSRIGGHSGICRRHCRSRLVQPSHRPRD